MGILQTSSSQAHHLEEDREAHDKLRRRQEILVTADHERACRQVLAAGRGLGHLQGRDTASHGIIP